ncbi:MAG: TfoX/Sxy family protein [Rhodobacteraceae bacterium]|nr:TfoX/Sxy family protein [Paracoccaceae bacterium]
MAVTAADIEHIHDLFSELEPLSTRKMMGGLCIYSDGQIFALIGPEEKLFIKATAGLAEKLAQVGSKRFDYQNKSGKTVSMPYWTLPDSALDDPSEACDWGRKSLIENR